MILAGDIGGTSTRLALFESNGGRMTPVAGATFPSASLPGLDEAIDQFINVRQRTIEAACFGIAGPVIGGRAQLPNLRWSVESEALAIHLGLPRVELVNDLEANAFGIPALNPDDLVPLNATASHARGNAAIISIKGSIVTSMASLARTARRISPTSINPAGIAGMNPGTTGRGACCCAAPKATSAARAIDALKKWFEVRARYLQWTDGRLAQMLIATDISARRNAEALAASQAEKAQVTKSKQPRAETIG